jgi:SAM-dependent methyltransferase
MHLSSGPTEPGRINPMSERTAEPAEIYDAFAEKYRAYSATKAAYIGSVDALVVEALSGRANVLLDYGAGDGVRGAGLRARLGAGYLVQADISPAMVEKCRALGASDRVFLVSDPGWEAACPPCTAALCLWNVLGHVDGTAARIAVLRTIRGLLIPGGPLCIDVNNRHYAGYGRWRSRARRVIDRLWRDDRRGDLQFNWSIDGVDYPSSGHIFTPAEMSDLLHRAGFEIVKRYAVDYRTGARSASLMEGQLFYIARRPVAAGGSA